MIKLFKNLKGSFVSILAIVALLVVQAICDLSLPDYTSKIVNVGIQYGGIEDSAAQVFREGEMKNIFLFLTEEEKSYLLENYDFYTKGNTAFIEKYPLLKEENLYVRKKKVESRVSTILTFPLAVLSMADSGQIEGLTRETIASLHLAPLETQKKFVENVQEKMGQYPSSMLQASAISYVQKQYVAIGMDVNSIQNHYIFITGLKMLGIAVFSMITTILVGLLGSRLAANLARSVRNRVFDKVVHFSKTEMKDFGQSSLITRTTNDIQQVQMILVMLFRVLFYAPIIGVGGVIKALNTNSSMTYIIAIAVVAVISLVVIMFAIVMPKFKVVQKLIDRLNLVTREILTGLPVIRAFSNEKYEEKRFDKANKDLTKMNIFVNRVMSFMMPMMNFIMNLVCLFIVWKGAEGVDSGSMQVGDIMAYIQYAMQIIMAFLMISMMSIMLPRASVSAKRINEVLERDFVVTNPEKEKPFEKDQKGVVEFRHVSFRYPDADYDVLTDINFKALPGKTTAFIGSTGSGKSTIINLIPRFFDVTDGTIFVSGVDIREVNMHTLRDKIGFVPQKGVLFSGSVESNLKYGNADLTEEEMIQYAKIAQADGFIQELEGKYQYPIAQGGGNVSGGQKQRLSIARALAKNPDIYIFDDSFSALDFKTDAILRNELKKITHDKTVLIVAQRISTIMNADTIVVLDEGKIVGMGTHQELMKTCKTYQEIALSQLSKEELDA